VSNATTNASETKDKDKSGDINKTLFSSPQTKHLAIPRPNQDFVFFLRHRSRPRS